MLLSGTELKALGSALFFYGSCPLPFVKRNLSEAQRALLDALFHGVLRARDRTWEENDTESAPTRAEVINRRLATTTLVDLSQAEEALAAAALEVSVVEVEDDGDFFIVSGAGEYGVTAETLRALRARLQSPAAPWSRSTGGY